MNVTERILAGEHLVPGAFIHLGLTGRCPARCVKCFVWKHAPAREDLPAAVWVRIVRELDELFIDTQVTFSGGEPLRYAGIYELIEQTRDLANVFAVVNTSAYFIDGWIADRLAGAGARIFGISLDGLPETNDRIKGVPGAFDGAMRAIDLLRERIPDALIALVYLLCRPTLAEAVPFARTFGRDPRVREVRFQPVFQPLGLPFERDWHVGHPLWPDPEEAAAVLDELGALRDEGYAIQNDEDRLAEIRTYFADPGAVRETPCPAGRETWVIDDRGTVYFCPYHEAVGDAVATPIARILASERARAAREKILTCDIRFCHLATNGRG